MGKDVNETRVTTMTVKNSTFYGANADGSGPLRIKSVWGGDDLYLDGWTCFGPNDAGQAALAHEASNRVVQVLHPRPEGEGIHPDAQKAIEGAAKLVAEREAEIARLTAELERVRKAGEVAAKYLDELGDNLLRNDADMQLDDCDDPKWVAETLRAALTRQEG